MNIILLCSLLWILPLSTGMMWWQERKSVNLVMGSRIPKEYQEDEEWEKIRRKFKKQLIWITVCLLPVPFLGFFIPYDSIIITMDMIWLLFVFLLPFLAFYQGNKKVKERKVLKGYRTGQSRARLVDTKAASIQRKVSHGSFLLACVVSFLPLIITGMLDLEAKCAVMLVTGALGSVTVLFWIYGYFCVHEKGEVISENSTINENFLRAKCKLWDSCMKHCAWGNALFTLMIYGLMVFSVKGLFWSGQGMAAVILCMLYCVVLVGILIRKSRKISRIRQKLMGEAGIAVDDDDEWICGMFYYNPNDGHFMIEKRVGIGTTVNLATVGGKIFSGITVASILLIPIVCIWMIFEEFTPVSVVVSQNDTVVVSHLKKEYEINISDINSVKLLDTLPEHEKIMGTDMQTLEKGIFSSKAYGKFYACLVPEKTPYLLLRTDKETYIFSASDEKVTKQIYETLCFD